MIVPPRVGSSLARRIQQHSQQVALAFAGGAAPQEASHGEDASKVLERFAIQHLLSWPWAAGFRWHGVAHWTVHQVAGDADEGAMQLERPTAQRDALMRVVRVA